MVHFEKIARCSIVAGEHSTSTVTKRSTAICDNALPVKESAEFTVLRGPHGYCDCCQRFSSVPVVEGSSSRVRPEGCCSGTESRRRALGSLGAPGDRGCGDPGPEPFLVIGSPPPWSDDLNAEMRCAAKVYEYLKAAVARNSENS
jgi:hypothetical protein